MQDVILIHGAWAGAWVWDTLLPALRDQGYRPHALDLPGNGHHGAPAARTTLDDYAAHVETTLASLPGKAFLVAHSGGGVTATLVAQRHPERVAGVVYVAGMMLPSGIGFATVTDALLPQDPTAAGISPHLTWNAEKTLSEVPADAARDLFFQDVDDDTAWAAARRLSAQPEAARAAVVRWTPERFGTVARLYVEARRDRSVVLAAQRWMQTHVPGAQVVSLDTGHAPQLSAPDELGDALLTFFHQVKSNSLKGTGLA